MIRFLYCGVLRQHSIMFGRLVFGWELGGRGEEADRLRISSGHILSRSMCLHLIAATLLNHPNTTKTNALLGDNVNDHYINKIMQNACATY